MAVFASATEREQFAQKFLAARLVALENDTAHCLAGPPYAPFPAILLSFSTIDLLGALAAGNALPGATGPQAAAYMQTFMKYTADQAKLLQALFRHKLVHLAQPKAVARHHGKFVTWRYVHDDPGVHLQLNNLSALVNEPVTSGLSLTIEQEFVISIAQLAKDVAESVRRPGDGYLAQMKTSPLDVNFDTAIFQIYTP